MSPSNNKAASKTKLMATRIKATVQRANLLNNGAGPGDRLLARMMERYQEYDGDDEQAATSFCNIMKDFGMNDRNTTQRAAWTAMIEEKQYIVAIPGGKNTTFTSDFKLTQAGLDAAAALGFELSVPSGKVATNAELHDRIKSKCMNKRGHDIFNLLLKKGSLSRTELAEKELKISNRGAYFSYALQQLKDLGYVEKDPADGKKLRLSDECFLSESDRASFREASEPNNAE
jgi:hypothetical protein